MTRLIATLLVGLAVTLAAHAAPADPEALEASPVIQTTNGPVQGSVQSANNVNVNVFHSIPFAAPPVGDLRFASPQPPKPWTSTKDASGFPNICPQLHIIGDLFLGNEDCLYLHVYAPQTTSNVKLPVMFWIFGGGYVMGDGYEFGFYDGMNMATKYNAIVVAPNYRVGPFGFLSTPELEAADPQHSTGNMALLDQTLALQWVRDNIANFNGDPSKVAIFGESAGGFSICWHLVSPQSKGLFSAAIMESGTCDSKAFFYGKDEAYAYGKNVTESFGCPGSGPDQLSCLRSVSVDKIMNAPSQTSFVQAMREVSATLTRTGLPAEMAALLPAPALSPIMPWGPVIDGVVLTEFPQTSLLSGNFNKVPTIFGTNKNEGRIFVPAMPLVVPGTHFPPTPDDIVASMHHFFSYYSSNMTVVEAAAQSVLVEYPDNDYANEWYRASAVLTHFFFTCPTRRSAEAIAAHGVPIYLYQFTYDLDWIEYGLLGDYHTSEIDFVFGNQWPPILHAFTRKSDFDLSDRMGQFWTNMAAVGSPNSQTTPFAWPLFNSTTQLNMNLSWPLTIKANLLEQKCGFWDNLVKTLNLSA